MRDGGWITLRAGSPPDRDETDGKLPAAVVRFHTDATWCRTTCCRSWPWSRWTPRPGAAPVTPRARRRRCSAPCVGQPAALRARPVSGVRQSAGGLPGSATETYPALRLDIENWRWADGPVFIRAGKALSDHVTEVRLLLRRTPQAAAPAELARADLNRIVLRIDPDPGLRLQLSALASQSPRVVHLDTSFARGLGEPSEPYERLLHAALKRRPQAVRRVGQCRGNLARRQSSSRWWTTLLPSARTSADRGGRPRWTDWSAAFALAAAVAGRGSLTPGTKPPERCLSRHQAARGPAAAAILRRCGG
jgi:hypothetical protein